MPSAAELRGAVGFFGGLREFLEPPEPGEVELGRRLESGRANREAAFAEVLRRAVFGRPRSPYRALLDRAGIEAGDVASMLDDRGLDDTLEVLHDAGVYATLAEFKGLQPIRRPGLELAVRAEDFDNPVAERQYQVRTGGSLGAARRVLIDLDLLAHEAAYHALFARAAGTEERPLALWHPAPPGAVGIKTALIQARLGRPVQHWFSQRRPGRRAGKHALFTRAAVAAAARSGQPIPMPEYTPATDAARVTAWLAERRSAGTPAVLVTTPSAGVRACSTALERGADIAGTFFVFVGEPYTEAKQAIVASAGCRAASNYAMVEAGLIGLACLAPDARDDVHVVEDKVATIRRSVSVDGNGRRVAGLFHTTLLAASPKLMLNVESGDFALGSRRECGCGALPASFSRHLHTIRSYEKLTSEGMSFLGGDLISLVEQVLPARFGGGPTDYQFVEREEGGLSKVSLRVGQGVGKLDHELVVEAVLDFWRSRNSGADLMADVWRQGRTLRVVRADPFVTPGGKTLPLQTGELA